MTCAVVRWQALLDGDLKEMQLHMDRLFVQNQMERERHEQQAAERSRAHEEQRARDREQHEANLKAMQLAALQQREQQADEVWRQCVQACAFADAPALSSSLCAITPSAAPNRAITPLPHLARHTQDAREVAVLEKQLQEARDAAEAREVEW